MKSQFGGIFEGKVVLVTGHTGFKGSWLTLWLKELGASVIGYSLAPPTSPSHFDVSCIHEGMIHQTGDICNYPDLKQTLEEYRPEVIFHLAAQSIVLDSYTSPKETFDVNVSGTINLLEAARHTTSVKAMVMVTSDKCYENQEWIWGYRENDALGGKDPYSASKGMAELAIRSYRDLNLMSGKPLAIASVRAGNVIGGGDFSPHRIVPDCMRALINRHPVVIRNPNSTRPWLYVLDALCGYLTLAERLLKEGAKFAGAWNFGPLERKAATVQSLVECAIEHWGDGDWLDSSIKKCNQEMCQLSVNWDKAATHLGWMPAHTWMETVQQTVDWFKSYETYTKAPFSINMRAVSKEHLFQYVDKTMQCINRR